MRSSNIMALQQKKATLVKSAKAILDGAKKDDRDLSSAEEQNFQKTKSAIDAVEREIVAEEARLVAENSGEAMPDENVAFAMMARGEMPPENPFAKKDRGRVGKCKYADLFGVPQKSAFRSFGEFARAVAHSHQLFDPRLSMAATTGLPSDAGFLVAPEQSAQIWDQILESEIVRPRAQVWPMASDVRKIPAVVDDDHSGSVLFGGMAAGWSAELEDLDTADMQVRLLQLSANKFGLLNNASNELLEDSSYEAVLSAKFQAGASWHIDNALLFGEGTGKPLGALNAGNKALVVVNKEGTQAADTLVYENVVNMYSTMAPACLSRAVWLFTSSLVPQLLKLQLVVTNKAGSENVGGSATPLLTVADDGSMILFTRPVIITEKLAAPGDQGDAAFVDFTQYAVGMRREIRLERSSHAGFSNDSTWFRLTCRLDGQPLWAKAQKLKNGETVSPFVTLQAR